ncbi:unnamed protein product [Arctogadus glacialis]
MGHGWSTTLRRPADWGLIGWRSLWSPSRFDKDQAEIEEEAVFIISPGCHGGGALGRRHRPCNCSAVTVGLSSSV